MREWKGFCKNAGVEGFMQESTSGRAYARMQEWQGLCNNAGVAGLM